jgi:hypothetical protein
VRLTSLEVCVPYKYLGEGISFAYWEGMRKFSFEVAPDYKLKGDCIHVFSPDQQVHGAWQLLGSDPRFQVAIAPDGSLSAIRETPLDAM